MHALELTWIQQLQAILRSPWMDRFFIGWNYVDTAPFTFLLILVVWYFVKRRMGIRLLYTFLLSGVVNKALKIFFAQPRPCQIDPSVGILCFQSGGMPSGAAQTAILLAGIVFFETKKVLYRYLALLFAVFLCFSRIYLGLHFFSDILGGLVVGGGLLIVYQKGIPFTERHWKLAMWIFPALLLLIGQSYTPLFVAIALGLALGFSLGAGQEIQRDNDPLWQRSCQFVLSLLGFLVFEFLLRQNIPRLPLFLALFLGTWISFCTPYLIYKMVAKD